MQLFMAVVNTPKGLEIKHIKRSEYKALANVYDAYSDRGFDNDTTKTSD